LIKLIGLIEFIDLMAKTNKIHSGPGCREVQEVIMPESLQAVKPGSL